MVAPIERVFSALILILSCSAGFSFTSHFRPISSSPASLLGLRLGQQGRAFPSHTLRCSNFNDGQNCMDGERRLAPVQLSMIGAPLKLVTGTVLGTFGFITREIKILTFRQKLFFTATFFLGFFIGRMRPFWKRYTDVNDIPSSLFGSMSPSLRGRAVTVSDGDTIRFLHQPTRFHPSQLRKEKGEKASTVALPIRLCTIDTPETAKFGKPGQPFGEEAKQHLKSLLQDKIVYARLLQKDQYSRAVAEVYTGRFPFWQRYMDAEMLKEGFAEVYTAGGAVYGPLGKEEYMTIEEKAKKAKKGIWSQGNRETAAEYKRRTKS